MTFYGEITIDVDKLLLKLLNTECHILDKQLLAVCFMIAASLSCTVNSGIKSQ